MNTNKTQIIAIDLETTHLIPDRGQILEASCYVLNEDLEEVDHFHGIFPISSYIRKGLSKFIIEMHTNNGLLSEKHTHYLHDFGNWLAQYNNIIFLGNSVNFDKSWIEYWLPEIKPILHYRVIDISSFFELCPEFKNTEEYQNNSKNHRSEGDIRWSIEQARFFRNLLLNEE